MNQVHAPMECMESLAVEAIAMPAMWFAWLLLRITISLTMGLWKVPWFLSILTVNASEATLMYIGIKMVAHPNTSYPEKMYCRRLS